MRALSLILVTLLTSGCIIEPPDLERLDGGHGDGGDPPPSTKPPLPPDGNWDWDGGLGGNGNGNGNGGGGKGGFPGGGGNGDPGTGVLWLVRADRGTANLAASYATLIQTMTQELAGQGLDIRTTAVGSLYDPRVYWAGEGKTLAVEDLRKVLEEAASSATGTSVSQCSTRALTLLGNELGQVPVVAPRSSNLGARPFQMPHGALLVVLLDHAARPQAYGPKCDSNVLSPAARFGGGREATQWLNTSLSGGWNLSRAQTRFLFVSTSEHESYAQLRERCASMSAFPRTALDSLAPSPIAYYEPFSFELNDFQQGLATQMDLCQAVAGDWKGFSREFAKDWVRLLKLPEEPR
jgi:hypothetical protein